MCSRVFVIKRLFVVFPLLCLAGCHYSSNFEAKRACERWESQEKELSQIKYIKTETSDCVHLQAVDQYNVITSRYSQENRNNDKFVGFENYIIQNEIWENKKGKKGNWKVVKYIHY